MFQPTISQRKRQQSDPKHGITANLGLQQAEPSKQKVPASSIRKTNVVPRVASLSQRRAARTEAAQKTSEEKELEKCVFHPQLCAKSTQLAAKRTSKSSAAHNRLFHLAKQKQEEERKAVQAKHEAQAAEEARKAARLKDLQTGEVSNEVFDRLHQRHNEITKHKNELREKMTSRDPVTGQKLFQPVVGRGPRGSFAMMAQMLREQVAQVDGDGGSGTSGGIHKYLFAERHAAQDLHEALKAVDDAERQKARDGARNVNKQSRHILEDVEREMLLRAFSYLRTSADDKNVSLIKENQGTLLERLEEIQPVSLQNLTKRTIQSLWGDYDRVRILFGILYRLQKSRSIVWVCVLRWLLKVAQRCVSMNLFPQFTSAFHAQTFMPRSEM